MNDCEKLIADAHRIIKHERAENADHYDGLKACSKIADLLPRNNPAIISIARQVGDYWYSTYITSAAEPQKEPSEENLDKISAMQNFLEGIDDENQILSQQDWQELAQIIRFEAEDMPLELLSSMMSLIVEHDAL